MSKNKVVWSEGLFLRPQHFQRAEAYFENLIDQKIDASLAYSYGYTELKIDQELLRFGKIGLAAASGLFPDGTPFDVPREAAAPVPFELPDETKNAVVMLTLPLRRPGMPEMAFDVADGSALVRYFAQDEEARDAVLEMESTAELKVGRLNLKIVLRDEMIPALNGLAIARVREKRSDGQVILDDQFIPTVIDCRASLRLHDLAKEVHGLLKHRSQALAERVSAPGGTRGVADFADFLLLQLCNRAEPLFAHRVERVRLHPEQLYCDLLQLAGELATFGREERGGISRRTAEFAPYRHDEPEVTFRPVMEEIRRALTRLIDQTAIPISLVSRGPGVYAGAVPDVHLLRGAVFMLAVNADVPSELLRTQFPTQVKIGPVEKLRDLVMSQLPGIVVQAQPVAPREIPYHAGFTYFELDRKSEFWKGMEASKVIAMHIAGDFPGLQLELWAIRRGV